MNFNSQDIHGKNIFITGGAGFIANNLIKSLVARNKITVWDNFTRDTLSLSKIANFNNINIVEGDVLDQEGLLVAMTGHEIVIHTAAIAGIDSVTKSSVNTMKVNLVGSLNALESAIQTVEVEKFINFSTSEVYGSNAFRSAENDDTSTGPIGESRWIYAVSKLASEHLACSYYRDFGLRVVNVRPFNVYGPGQTGEGALSMFIKSALRDEEIYIHGDGSQIRSWCFVTDFVQGILGCISNESVVGSTINLGNADTAITIKNLAETVCRVLNSKSKVVFKDKLREDVAIRVPNILKAEQLLGFKPVVGLEEGIFKTAKSIS